MATVFVARSPALGDWASDVGLSKNVFKFGWTEGDAKAEVKAGWCGLADWVLIKARDAGEVAEAKAFERVRAKAKQIDPTLYPRLKGDTGIFKVTPAQVENHLLVARALAGEAELKPAKLKPADFATYFFAAALG